MSNLKSVTNKEFICLLIEDELKDAIITGCDHLSMEAVNHVEKRFEIKEQELKSLSDKSI